MLVSAKNINENSDFLCSALSFRSAVAAFLASQSGNFSVQVKFLVKCLSMLDFFMRLKSASRSPASTFEFSCGNEREAGE